MDKRRWVKVLVIVLAVVVVLVLGSIILFGGKCSFFEKYILKVECNRQYDLGPTDYFDNPASIIEPITVSDIILNSAESRKIQIGFYCNDSKTCENAKPQITKCFGPDGLDKPLNERGITFNAMDANIKPHTSIGYMTLIKKYDYTQLGDYVCNIKVDDYINPGQPWAKQKQIMLTIT